jgi:hypothetical protein
MESLFEDGADDVLYFRILADALVCWIELMPISRSKSAKEAGMIDLIMKYLSRAKGDPVSQKWGLRAMRYLFSRHSTCPQPPKNEEGILHFVLRQLEVYRDAWDVQHWGIRVLCCMTYNNCLQGSRAFACGQIALFIVENEVLDIVSEALDSHQTNCTVQTWCLQILCNILNDFSRAQIIEKHLSKILSALHKHEDNLAVQRCASGLLGALLLTPQGSLCSKLQTDVLKAGAIPLILKGITNFSSDRKMQNCGIKTIQYLITGNIAASQQVGEEGGIGVLLAAMSNHFNVIEIQKQGFITLQRLAVDPMNQERFRFLRGTLEKLGNRYITEAHKHIDRRTALGEKIRKRAQEYKAWANALRRGPCFAFETDIVDLSIE